MLANCPLFRVQFKQDSSNIKALKFKSDLLYFLKRWEESNEVCNLILKKSPENIEVLNFKAANLFQLNRYKECIEVCQKILDIDPKNKDALEQWESASIITDDDSLPKPPKSIIHKIIEFLIIIGIFGAITYYLIHLS